MNLMKHTWWALFLAAFLFACEQKTETTTDGESTSEEVTQGEDGDWKWQTEQFADLRILRYKVPGFEELPLKQKQLLYYLSEAALSGRDIIYDQNYKHNIYIRRTLENIYKTYIGEKSGENWEAFMTYTKRVWFSNGIHHHYSTKKIEPGFDYSYFEELVRNSSSSEFPLAETETLDELLAKLKPIIFDPTVDPIRVNQAEGADLAAESANNYYEGLAQMEVEAYYEGKKDANPDHPVSHGLNSKLIKTESGNIEERVWKVGGMYSDAIKKIVFWLNKAVNVAENEKQKKALMLLVDYYETGDLAKFDDYNIAWVQDTESDIDVINGFIEVYGDALGYRGAYESVVQITDPEASKRIEAISEEAQWFEDNSPIMDEHKKAKVKGISARVINVVMESGDASPSTPIGINLPNSNWIRAEHGSKSVNLANIVNAYDEASKSSGVLQEFAWDEEEVRLAKEYGALADNLHTDMHEVIGHASGKINPGIGTPKQTLKSYASALEEGRADLVALYYMMDQKLVDMGLMPSLDVGKEAYNSYIRNGLMLQLRRLDIGEDIQEAHMRNRQFICNWVMEKGAADKVIEKKMRDGKTYFVINDYMKLRDLFGQLLREIQRMKSEGDYEAGKALVENYGVKVDQEVHQEVLDRVAKLNIAPYSGFINPVLTPVKGEKGSIIDVKISYPEDFTEQHIYYSEKYSHLPTYN
jgi:dipeptidyl-peptidase-3